jgi:hypothetical protein
MAVRQQSAARFDFGFSSPQPWPDKATRRRFPRAARFGNGSVGYLRRMVPPA